LKKTDLDRFDGRLKNASEANKINLKRFKAAANVRSDWRRHAQETEAAAARKSARTGQGDKVATGKKKPRAAGRVEILPSAEEEQAEGARGSPLKRNFLRTVEQALAQPETRESGAQGRTDRRYAAQTEPQALIKPKWSLEDENLLVNFGSEFGRSFSVVQGSKHR